MLVSRVILPCTIGLFNFQNLENIQMTIYVPKFVRISYSLNFSSIWGKIILMEKLTKTFYGLIYLNMMYYWSTDLFPLLWYNTEQGNYPISICLYTINFFIRVASTEYVHFNRFARDKSVEIISLYFSFIFRRSVFEEPCCIFATFAKHL